MSTVASPGKWIKGLAAEAPVSEAAERVLRVRLKGVEDLLNLAARARDDVEYVHQLRVVTRRSDAALRIFERCLDASELRKARRRLKKVRRAAAAARECDVQRAVIEADRKEAPERLTPAFDMVLAQLHDERCDAQRTIRAAAKRHDGGERLRRGRRKLLGSIRPPPEAPDARLADVAGDTVPELVELVRNAARADLKDVANLHALRIRSKRLRYALEVFAPCFGEGFREVYADVETLQETLGAINDSNDLVERFEAWAGEAVGGAAATGREAVEHYRRRRDHLIESFLESWTAATRARLFGSLERVVSAGAACAAATAVGHEESR